ncbi:MAG: hypothetical protein R3Y58_14515, partial [Eubacteriales bacterium]
MKQEVEPDMHVEEYTNNNTAILFISFDLVNSTLYKSTHPGTWVSGISDIIEHIIHRFTEKSNDGYHFWKVLGDEVVFTKNIPYLYELNDILQYVYNEVVHTNTLIKHMLIGDEETAKLLSIKSTVWVAGISSTRLHADNFYTEYTINDNQLQSEYLGTDIDAGFRLSHFTSSNRVAISFELAAFFIKDPLLRKNIENVHFVGYRLLKGIWNGNAYPIFMYHGDSKVTFTDSIVNHLNSQTAILEEYLNHLPQRKTEEPFDTYEEQLLSTLCSNDSRKNKVENLVNIIRNQSEFSLSTNSTHMRVHYSVLCYSIDECGIRFMITTNQNEEFGFGGSFMSHNLEYLNTINLYYQEEFGVDLEFVKDTRYHDPIPLILSTYTIEESESLKGSIFLAKISS